MKQIALLVSLLLAGCSHYSVHTNLDKKNFTEYFKPGTVTVLDKSQLADLNYLTLGTIEGESCQSDADQPAPNLGDARTDARRKVADMGGNAVVFGKCVTFTDTPGCLATLVCYGQALKVADPNKPVPKPQG